MKLKDYFFLRDTVKKFAFSRSFCLFTLLIVFSAFSNVYGQTVSITASQPNASEQGPVNGQYTINVFGAGGITGSVEVFLSIGGFSTATSVDDYVALPASVNIGTFFGSGSALVTLSVVDDNLIEGAENVILTIVNDPSYTIGVGSATVNITDNDVAGVNVNPTSGNTTEAGGEATFVFTLTSQPSADVTIPINGYDITEMTAPASIVISPANWNTGVNLVISGVDDPIVDGDFIGTINTGNVTSADPNYDALVGADVAQITITNLDDDVPGVNVDTTTGTTTEGGGTATFIYTLTSQPTANVILEVDQYDTTETSGPATITITPGNWNTGVPLVINGLDDNEVDGDIVNNIRVRMDTSADPAYDSLSNGEVPDLVVINQDDDVASINVSAISGNTSEAGGTATFNVTLTSQPANNVTIALLSNDTSEGTVPATVVKTRANWNVNTEVTVTGVDDEFVDGNVVYTIETGNVTSSDANYNALNGAAVADVTVTNIDDDTGLVSVIANIPDASEEGPVNGRFRIEINKYNATGNDLTVNYTLFGGTATQGNDYTVTGTATFNAGELARNINVIPIDDVLFEPTETVILTLNSTNNPLFAIGTPNTATVGIEDNDSDNCVSGPILDTTVPTIFCGVKSETGPTPIFQNTTVTSLNDYTQSQPPANNPNISLRWSTLSDSLNENAYLSPAQVANPTVEGSYFGFFLDNNGTPNNPNDDCTSRVIEVELTLNIIPDVPVGTGNERCGPGTVLLTASTTSSEASLNWYSSIDSDTPLLNGSSSFTTPPISTTTSFYVEAVENTCASERVEVVATVGFQPSAGTPANTSICNVPENGPTILDLDDRLAGEGAGTWAITTYPSGGAVTIQTSNIVDFRDLPAGNYVFTFTTTGSTPPCTNASSEVTISVSDCDTDQDGDGLFGGDEATLGTDPNNADTDGDAIEDGDEVGPDVENPIDTDNDGDIDALESNVLDADNDGVVDQLDPADDNVCIPNRVNGVCDFDGDTITDADEIASGSDPDNPCDPNADSPTCPPIDLEITKLVNGEEEINSTLGETVVFTITITNPADRFVRNIVVGDLLETGFDLQSVDFSSESDSYSEDTGEWNISEIAPMSSETLSITATIVEGSSYSNTAELLSSLPVDDNQDNNVATVQVNIDIPEGIDLAIKKTVNNRAPLVGEEITFTISVENQSDDSAIVSNIQVEDVIPTGPDARFIYVSHAANVGAYDPISGIWTIESLAVGEGNIATLDITVTVPREGIFANTATILRSSPIDNPENNVGFVDVTVSFPTSANPGFLFNQFSPNGDESNDVLRINLRDSTVDPPIDFGINYAIQVFDRYGNLVFKGTDSIPPNVERKADVWDGTYKGKDVPKGTYFYILNYELVELVEGNEIVNAARTDKGWIQLIR